MAVSGISAIQPAISPTTTADPTTASSGVAGASGSGGGGSSSGAKTIVSTVSVTNSNGTITTTVTYSDGSTSVTTAIDPNAPDKAAKAGAQPVSAKPNEDNNPAQLSTLLNAQEQSGTGQIQARPKGDLADL